MSTADGPGPFALLLHQHRLRAGLSQEELAELAGLSRRGITDLERGARRSPHPTTVRLLAEALRLPESERATFIAAARADLGPARVSLHIRDAELPVRRPGVELHVEGEYKQATVLCCQFVEPASRSERLGPEAVLDTMHYFLREAAQEIARYDGSVSAVLGDELVALFGVPVAHEDHARRAILAALGIQRRVKAPLLIRIGLHTGWLAVARIGAPHDELTATAGETAAVAAAIQRSTEPGSISISNTTARLLRGFVTLAPAGDTEWGSMYRVTGIGPRRAAFEDREVRELSQFVGRDSDLTMLLELWRRAEDGNGHVVGIVGEPGMGKSRLVYEFRRRMAEHRVTYLEGRCLSYGGTTPYLPIIDLVRANCGILESDEAQVIAQKVRFGFQEADLDPDEHAPCVLDMLGIREAVDRLSGLSPEVVRARTFETLRTWVLAGSRKRPVVIVIEDVHWIDSTSAEYLSSLIDCLSGAPVLLVCTWRPGHSPQWAAHSYVTQLALRPLGENESLSMLRSMLRPEQMSKAVAHGILRRAEGNPLFLEELVRSLLAADNGSSAEVLPDAIQGVLAARIDRLPPGPRTILQSASAIGRDFSSSLLHAICDDAAELESDLDQLQRLEFIYRRGQTREAVFSFKHALTQEAAYVSLTATRRKRLHERIARALLAQSPEIAEAQPELVARHFTEGGVRDLAIEYWHTAGDRAAERSANVEAISHFRTALRLLAELPENEQHARRELALQIALGGPLFAIHGYGAAETLGTYTRARQLAEQVNEPAQLFPLLFRQWVTHTIRSEEHDALAAAEEFINLAQQQPESGPRMMGHRLLGVTLFMLGDFSRSRQELNRALAAYDPDEHRAMAFRYGQEPRATALVWGSIGLWLTGSVDEAERMMEEAMVAASESGHVNTRAFVLSYGRCLLETLRGDASAIERWLSSLDALAAEHHLTMWRAYAMVYSGWATAKRGDAPDGIARMRAGLDAMRAAGTDGIRPHLLGLLAGMQAQSGQTNMALEALTEAFDQIARGGERWCEAELHRLRGEVLRASGGLANAEVQACLTRALAVAGAQGAVTFERRIIASMRQDICEERGASDA